MTQTFDAAVTGRPDFVEGRVLAAACHLYGGNPDRAIQLLQEASGFLTKHQLNVSPLGQDCCAGWLILGQPKAVDSYVAVLKDTRRFPTRLRTPFQDMLIAVHAWQNSRYNEAEEYFESALRKTGVWKADMIDAQGPVGLVSDAATFFFLARTAPPRDPARGEKLLVKVAALPPENVTWALRRARAALQAHAADQLQGGANPAEAAAHWDSAVVELEKCRLDCLPSLDAEIDEQLRAYRERKPWYRQ